ncbi:YfgM family protein [Nitrincola iocasae]|uniref:Ancillary SecYEG translocon subunit n=1 Tax=Nitrincola iocasae TaxID=2614693 RepID=A0A5J6LAF0_9GAMM|nr:tetratricopeptide repeat protein [Nitrincola iocasae]QEW05487.1 tetratricopeptide repeat protein [Nitrincola iocasae]
MAELRSEEEQLEALKSWWKENGRSLMIGVVVAVAAVLGWQGWQSYTENQAAQASWLYQNMLEAVSAELDENPDPQVETILHLGNRLKNEHEKSTYAQYAALMLARAAVQQAEYAAALEELDWVLARTQVDDLKRLATLRKASVLLATDQFDQAGSLLSGFEPGSYSVIYYELLGDIAFSKGDLNAAVNAYDQALAAAGNAPTRPVLQMKRDDLGEEAGS